MHDPAQDRVQNGVESCYDGELTEKIGMLLCVLLSSSCDGRSSQSWHVQFHQQLPTEMWVGLACEISHSANCSEEMREAAYSRRNSVQRQTRGDAVAALDRDTEVLRTRHVAHKLLPAVHYQ